MNNNVVISNRKRYERRKASRFHTYARRGLSLLEVLVTLVIVALISVAALQVFSSTTEGIRRLQQDMVREDSDRETAHMTIIAESGARRTLPSRLVEWVAMPRDEFNDLVLYRRVYPSPDRRTTKYIPMCEGIYSFVVEELTDTLLQATAWVYRDEDNDPRSVFPVSRMFCVERFKFYSHEGQRKTRSR